MVLKMKNPMPGFEAYDLACLADDALRKCGLAAKIVILQMIKKLNYLDYSCPENVKEPLMNLIEILNFEKEDVIHLKEIFGIPSDNNDK
ncbi:hypothetical protein CDAR_620041 [Caerostris darwini]|uniref:Uncharacterized protein n=1 Tax=Caerostris darwini TaxID=1538125 RepID=A0AAV4TYM1_9ARAC|nr:hypothetical protein CDAR_620041 [Caerostris darwini]